MLDRAGRDIYNAKLLLSPEGNSTNDELLDDMVANDITSWEAHSRYDDSPVSAREEFETV